MISLRTPKVIRTPVGLDIGARGVRAAQLVRKDGAFVVSAVAAHAFAADTTDGEKDHFMLKRRIESCVRGGDFRGRTLITALNHPAVEFHALELPEAVLAAPSEDAQQIVQWEMARLVSAPIEEVETRFWALPETPATNSNAIGVAARKDAVMRLVSACAEAGMNCAGVNCATAGLARFGVILDPPDQDMVWGVLDLGATSSRLVLCIEQCPVLVRQVGEGGDAWTRKIADTLDISEQAAETHKCDHASAPVARGSLGKAPVEPVSDVAPLLGDALRGSLTAVASEIKRSYEYVLSCYPQHRAGRLQLVGGGAAMRNLPTFFTHALGIDVRRVSENCESGMTRIEYAESRHGPLEVTALAIGLALSAEMGE